MTMTMQQIFDTCALHLLQQGEKSTVCAESTSCKYRGPRGLKCAVGFLIQNHAYHERLEGHRVHNSGVIVALQRSGVLEDALAKEEHLKVDLLGELQHIHDQLPVHNWLRALESVARRFKLRMPELMSECVHENCRTRDSQSMLREDMVRVAVQEPIQQYYEGGNVAEMTIKTVEMPREQYEKYMLGKVKKDDLHFCL